MGAMKALAESGRGLARAAGSVPRLRFSATFDYQALRKGAGLARRKSLMKAGAYMRRAVRSGIKRRKKATTHSAPGQPPYTHTGFFKDMIVFAFDPSRDAVVVGPFKGTPAVLQLHEYGGLSPMKVDGKVVMRRYPERSYMRSAIPKGQRDLARKFPEDFLRAFRDETVGIGPEGAVDYL